MKIFKPERGIGMGRLSIWELLLVLGITLVIFGPSKLPELGRSLGRGIREFKNATREMTSELSEVKKEVEEPKKA